MKIVADKEKGTCKRGCTAAMTVRGDYEHTEIVFQEAFLQEECGNPKRGNTPGRAPELFASERSPWGPVSSLFIFDIRHTAWQALCSVEKMFCCFDVPSCSGASFQHLPAFAMLHVFL